MLQILLTYFIFFIIYSIIGWIAEMLYCRMLDGVWTNRGFLYGPYCPIYGFGSLLIILFLERFNAYPVLVFFLGMLFTSTLEYFSSFILEKMFNAKWWDYSERKFNLNGRICLLNSLEFATLGMILTYIVHPLLSIGITNLSSEHIQLICIASMSILALDTGFSTATLLNLRDKLQLLKTAADKFKNDFDPRITDLRNSLTEKSSSGIRRILKAFPNFEFKDFKVQIKEFKSDLNSNNRERFMKLIEDKKKKISSKKQKNM